MKFSVTRNKDLTFSVHMDTNPPLIHILQDEIEMDEFILNYGQPMIQVLPSGKENIIQ